MSPGPDRLLGLEHDVKKVRSRVDARRPGDADLWADVGGADVTGRQRKNRRRAGDSTVNIAPGVGAIQKCALPENSSPSGGNINRTITRSEEHTSELQSHLNLVCRLLLEKKKSEALLDANHIL